MNLENLGVQEMNAMEIKNVDGGTWKWVYRAASAVWEAIQVTVNDPETYYGDQVDNPMGNINGGL